MEEIVEISLPDEMLAVHYQDPEAAKMCILNKISFFEARQKVLLLSGLVMDSVCLQLY